MSRRLRSKGALPPVEAPGDRYSYVVHYCNNDLKDEFVPMIDIDDGKAYPCAGVFPDYDAAIEAIALSIKEAKESPLSEGPTTWEMFAVVMHMFDTATVGRPDAVRRFRGDGTPYIPTLVSSDELKESKRVIVMWLRAVRTIAPRAVRTLMTKPPPPPPSPSQASAAEVTRAITELVAITETHHRWEKTCREIDCVIIGVMFGLGAGYRYITRDK